ncbi:MAG: DUF2325 domain-containing protein [Pseudomonadota bacterium]|nr:DUF2325 domain-containing protein [Pseudomonadota bacterium]
MVPSVSFDILKFEPRDHHQGTKREFVLSPLAPPLVARTEPDQLSSADPPRRAKIWEFNPSLHCSIIGTCLSTAELRRILAKLGLAQDGESDHDLHARAVTLAARHDSASKRLNKALDQQHRLAIHQFDKAKTEQEVGDLWRAARQRGDIPGAYWAALTHPASTRTLIRDAFGHVHMLSHLVGAANRADIRRLSLLEAEKAELEAKLRRQQTQLRDAVASRDAQIRQLQQALASRIVAEEAGGGHTEATATTTLRQLVADLERRFATETRRRITLEQRLSLTARTLDQERERHLSAQDENHVLRDELSVIEAAIRSREADANDTAATTAMLDGLSLLYVGGRPNQVAHLRALGESLGGVFLYHDGGIEDRSDLLPGLATRADLVLFPVDCISHDAALRVKRLCRQAGKRYIPLRSSGTSSFLAALDRLRRA